LGGRQKKLTTFFNRRFQNTGRNYQINHSNPKKRPRTYNGLLVLQLHTAAVTKDWRQGSGLGAIAPLPQCKTARAANLPEAVKYMFSLPSHSSVLE